MNDSELQIRPATIIDAALLARLNRAVQELHVAADPSAYRSSPLREVEESFAKLLKERSTHAFIASIGAHPAGYVIALEVEKAASAFKNEDRYLELDQIAVEPDCRRLGVGARLVREIEALARARSLRVELTVRAFNRDAIAFYERLGFLPSLYRLSKQV